MTETKLDLNLLDLTGAFDGEPVMYFVAWDVGGHTPYWCAVQTLEEVRAELETAPAGAEGVCWGRLHHLAARASGAPLPQPPPAAVEFTLGEAV